MFRQRADGVFEFVTGRIEEWTGVSAQEWRDGKVALWELVHEGDWPAYAQFSVRAQRSKGHKRDGETTNGDDDAGDGPAISFRVRNRSTGRITRIVERRRTIRAGGGAIIGFHGVWTDVTAQSLAARRMELTLWHAAFAQITSGAAHDLNNKLTGILSFSDLYLEQAGPDHPFHAGLTTIKQTAQQASHMLHRLAAMVSARPGKRELIDLNHLISGTVDFLRSVVSSRIQIDRNLHPEPMPLYVDPARLQRLLLELAVEAAARMPERGVLSINTARQRDGAEGDTGDTLRLTLMDEGHEIPKLSSWRGPAGLESGETGPANAMDQLIAFTSELDGSVAIDSTRAGTRIEITFPAADMSAPPAEPKPMRPWILVETDDADSLAWLLDELRRRHITAVIASNGIEPQLDPDHFAWDAVLLHVAATATPELLRSVRARKIPAIVYLAGGDVTDLDPMLVGDCAVAMPPDLPRGRVVEKIVGYLGGDA